MTMAVFALALLLGCNGDVPSLSDINPFLPVVGTTGKMLKAGDDHNHIEFEVVSVVDQKQVILIPVTYRGGTTRRPPNRVEGRPLWISGIDTRALTDGRPCVLNGYFKVVGTKQYETAGGSMRTVFHIATFDVEPLMRAEAERKRIAAIERQSRKFKLIDATVRAVAGAKPGLQRYRLRIHNNDAQAAIEIVVEVFGKDGNQVALKKCKQLAGQRFASFVIDLPMAHCPVTCRVLSVDGMDAVTASQPASRPAKS